MLFLLSWPPCSKGASVQWHNCCLKQGLWAASLPSGSWSCNALPDSVLTFPASPPPRSSHYCLSNFQALFWFQIPFSFLSLGNLFLYVQLCGFNFLLFFYTEFLCVVCPSCGRQHWVMLRVFTVLVTICLPLLATAPKLLEAGNFSLDSWVPT